MIQQGPSQKINLLQNRDRENEVAHDAECALCWPKETALRCLREIRMMELDLPAPELEGRKGLTSQALNPKP